MCPIITFVSHQQCPSKKQLCWMDQGQAHEKHDVACPNHHDENNEFLVLMNVVYVAIVTLCSGFVIFTYFKFKDLRTRSFAMVLQLSVSDLCSNISYSINPNPNAASLALCSAQGFLLQLFTSATVGWTLLIALTLDLLVVQHKPAPSFEASFALIWGLSALTAAIPLFVSDGYGKVSGSGWCWVHSATGAYLDFALFYVPCGLTMAIVTVRAVPWTARLCTTRLGTLALALAHPRAPPHRAGPLRPRLHYDAAVLENGRRQRAALATHQGAQVVPVRVRHRMASPGGHLAP